MFCQNCGNQVDDTAGYCPTCGSKIIRSTNVDTTRNSVVENEEKIWGVESPKKRYGKFVLAILIGIAIIGVIVKCMGGVIGNSLWNHYEPCPDLEIVCTYADGNDGYYTIKNTGEKTIKDYEVAYVGYDTAGNTYSLGIDTIYDTNEVTSANLLPGTSAIDDIGLFYEDIMYFDAVVSSVTYMDNSTWSAKGLDAWAKEVSDSFTIEGYRQSIEALQSDAVLAESNPYLQITSSEKWEINSIFSIETENIGNKTIKDFTIIILEYDQNGYAVDVSLQVGKHYDVAVVRNAKNYTFESINLESQKQWGDMEYYFNWESNCTSYKVIVYAIDFVDGTTWTNDYAMQWELYNENER